MKRSSCRKLDTCDLVSRLGFQDFTAANERRIESEILYWVPVNRSIVKFRISTIRPRVVRLSAPAANKTAQTKELLIVRRKGWIAEYYHWVEGSFVRARAIIPQDIISMYNQQLFTEFTRSSHPVRAHKRNKKGGKWGKTRTKYIT